MPIDVYFINAVLQSLALIVIMTVFFVLRKSFRGRAMLIGIELILLTMLIWSIDDAGAYFGIDIIGRPVLVILEWAVIVILTLGLVHVWRQRVQLHHIANLLKTDKRYVEALSNNSEVLKQNGGVLAEHERTA